MNVNVNSNAYSISNPLYNKYVDVGFSSSLVWLYTPSFVLGLVGMVLNASLVYVTWKCRATLRSLFNLLIAVECLGSFCWETSFVLPWFFALSGANLVSAELCFYLQFFSNWGLNVQLMTMLFIALERICCIIFPIWSSLGRKVIRYKIVLNLISFTYGLINNAVIYLGILSEFREKLVLCFMGDNRSAFSKLYSYRTNLSLEICTVIVYCLIWIQMAKGAIKKVKITSATNMHILKSVSIIIVLCIFGWALNGLSPFYLPLLKLSPEDSLNFTVGLVQLTLITSASNGLILYFYSTDYRSCFGKTFQCLARRRSVVPSPIVQVPSPPILARRQGYPIAKQQFPIVVN